MQRHTALLVRELLMNKIINGKLMGPINGNYVLKERET